MKKAKDKIYYVTGDSYEAAKNSPHLEVFRKKGIEVLLLSDRIDEVAWPRISPNSGGQATGVGRPRAIWILASWKTKPRRTSKDESEAEFKDLTTKIKEALGDKGQGSARHPPPHRLARVPGL